MLFLLRAEAQVMWLLLSSMVPGDGAGAIYPFIYRNVKLPSSYRAGSKDAHDPWLLPPPSLPPQLFFNPLAAVEEGAVGLLKRPTDVWSIWLDVELAKIMDPKKIRYLGGFALPMQPRSILPFPCSGATQPGTR